MKRLHHGPRCADHHQARPADPASAEPAHRTKAAIWQTVVLPVPVSPHSSAGSANSRQRSSRQYLLRGREEAAVPAPLEQQRQPGNCQPEQVGDVSCTTGLQSAGYLFRRATTLLDRSRGAEKHSSHSHAPHGGGPHHATQRSAQRRHVGHAVQAALLLLLLLLAVLRWWRLLFATFGGQGSCSGLLLQRRPQLLQRGVATTLVRLRHVELQGGGRGSSTTAGV